MSLRQQQGVREAHLTALTIVARTMSWMAGTLLRMPGIETGRVSSMSESKVKQETKC